MELKKQDMGRAVLYKLPVLHLKLATIADELRDLISRMLFDET